MKKILMALAAVLCCIVATAVFTACSENETDPVNPKPGVDGRIVGNWCSNVSGKTYAKWTYGDTWQTTEFKADGTGSTRIYYTTEGMAIGCEKIDFTYTASADGELNMTPKDREAMKAKWEVDGGELRLGDGDGLSLTFNKTTTEMAAKFEQWSKTEDMFNVPQPAKYTVFVYGNAGGLMDNIIEEGFWEKAKEFLTDHNNVRVVCMYKYGQDLPEEDSPFTGKYADPGDIVWFELTNKTDLNRIKKEGMQAIGMGEEAKKLKICDPKTLKTFMEFSSLACPAEEYVFGVWGHGSGFDALMDVPHKYEMARPTIRGVMADEWNDDEELDMYELHDAIKASGIDRLNTLFFHNCMMGNLETLTQVKDCADYICCSAHVLASGGEVLTEFVRGLVDKDDAEDAVGQMFERITPVWENNYCEDREDLRNGDFKMYRSDKFDGILDAIRPLADRLIALYPTQREAIDRATKQAYRYEALEDKDEQYLCPFFDIADYAHLLAKETDDTQLKTIASKIDEAFAEAFIHYRDINWCKQHLGHYTLSICLLNNRFYTYDYKGHYPFYLANYYEGYEQCGFHKYTGWGNWLRTNLQELDSNPQNTGGGPLE